MVASEHFPVTEWRLGRIVHESVAAKGVVNLVMKVKVVQ